jgi:hypothetical protein
MHDPMPDRRDARTTTVLAIDAPDATVGTFGPTPAPTFDAGIATALTVGAIAVTPGTPAADAGTVDNPPTGPQPPHWTQRPILPPCTAVTPSPPERPEDIEALGPYETG